MSRRTDLYMRQLGVNPHKFYGDTPHIWLRTTSPRDGYPSGYYVTKRGVDLTDGGGHFMDHGSKFFSYHGKQGRIDALQAAIEWAVRRFDIPHWTRDPWGGLGPLEFVNAHVARLDRKVKDIPAPKLKLTKRDPDGEHSYDVVYKDEVVARVQKTQRRGPAEFTLFDLEGENIGTMETASDLLSWGLRKMGVLD